MAGISGGLEGVVAAETMLSHVDGERGELIIRRTALGAARAQAFGALEDWLPATQGRAVPEAIRMALAALPDSASAEQIAATLPVGLAAILRARRGLSPVAPDPSQGT